jgi:hypothetical protein
MMQTGQNHTGNSEAALFGRLFVNDKHRLTTEVARYILDLAFSEEDKARMHELAGKNREGTISPKELRELDDYVKVGDLVAILKSKARMALKKKGPKPQHLHG